MSNEEIFSFLNAEFEKAQNLEEDDFGYNEVVEKRVEKKEEIRKRLEKYYLSEKVINDLLKIIEKSEEKIDKIKKSYNPKKAKPGDAQDMFDKIVKIQEEMKKTFEEELLKAIKKNYEMAKKIIEERKNGK